MSKPSCITRIPLFRFVDIALLQAWITGKPVLVNGACDSPLRLMPQVEWRTVVRKFRRMAGSPQMDRRAHKDATWDAGQALREVELFMGTGRNTLLELD